MSTADLVVLEDVLATVDHQEKNVDSAQSPDIRVGQWAIVSQVSNAQSTDSDAVHRILLSELLAPRIGVLPRDARDVQVAHRERSWIPRHANGRRPLAPSDR